MRVVTLTKQQKVEAMLEVTEAIQKQTEQLHDYVIEGNDHATRRATEEVRCRLLVVMQFAKEIYDDSF